MKLSDLRRQMSERLAPVCGEDAPFDTDLLIEKCYEISFSKIPFEVGRQVDPTAIEPLILRRLSGEPTQYILGMWEFYGLPFCVGEGVLIPRPDTELLVEKGLELVKNTSNPRVLDLCSGSGCVAIAIKKHRPDAKVWAVELYDRAASYLNRNALLNGVDIRLLREDVLQAPPPDLGEFDLIISNPPYIDGEAMAHLADEVKREPHTALFGGDDGLVFYRAIADKWLELLDVKGALAVEIGFDQGKSVADLFKACGLNTCLFKDYGGNDRVIIGTQNHIL